MTTRRRSSSSPGASPGAVLHPIRAPELESGPAQGPVLTPQPQSDPGHAPVPRRGPGRVVRVLIIADTHGALDARIAALAARCDAVVHAGDVGAAQVLAACAPVPVYAVRGNNDVPAKWIGAPVGLPARCCVDLPGGLLAAEHGDRHPAATRHARLRAAWPQARAVVYGHSHRAVLDTDARPWVLNPGAAGRARTGGGPSALLLWAGAWRWKLRAVRYPPLAPAGAKRSARKLRMAAKARRATTG